MAQITEYFNGGVVQTRHPLMLNPSELQNGDDCIYRPGDRAIHRAPGRTKYGSVVSRTLLSTTNFTTTLTSANLFGTNFVTTTVTSGSLIITKAAAFGAVTEGQSVFGTGIPLGAVVRRVIDTSNIELDLLPTATGTPTVVISDLHVGTFLIGNGIPTGAYIVNIASAGSLTMSAPATNNTNETRLFVEGVDGLRVLKFDESNRDIILAKARDKLYYSPLVGLTGTFTELAHGLSSNADSQLETIQYNDKHIVLTGYDEPRLVYYKDGVVKIRSMGMKPVTSVVGVSTTAGALPAVSSWGSGWYYILVTEVYNPDQPDEVEGTFTSEDHPAGYSIHVTDATTQGILVSYMSAANKPINDGLYGRNLATHWRIYISQRQAEELPTPDLSTFVLMATVGVGEASKALSTSNPWQLGYAQVLATYGGYVDLFPANPSFALSSSPKQTLSCTTAVNSNVLTSAALFGSVFPGMLITSTTVGNIPYGTVVTKVTSTSSLVMSNPAVAVKTEATGFGNLTSFDNIEATCPTNPVGNYRANEFRNFGFNNIGGFTSGTITGVRIEIKGRNATFLSPGDTGFYVSLNKNGTISDGGVERWVTLPYMADLVVSLGGQSDMWGLTLSPADFADGATWGVRIRKHSSASDRTHIIDGIRMTVYAGGSDLNYNGQPFRTIIISDQVGATSFGVGANGPPPIASTGDVYDGRVILNDTRAPSVLVSSLPGADGKGFEAYPDPYRIPLEGKEKDRVKVIRKVGTIIAAGCLNSVIRMNYFPTENDAEFSKGRCYEDIATDHGMVGPRAAKMIDLPGRGPVLLYQASNGPHWTDGVTTTPMNEDLDWANLIEPTLIGRTVFEVYPRLYLIAMYYVPKGQTRATKVVYFAYHPIHMKPGFRLPAIGPVGCEGASAANFLLNGVPYLFTGHARDGYVYVEDNGTVDTSFSGIVPNIRTRQIFASGIGRAGRLERMFLIADAAGLLNDISGQFTATLRRQNQGEIPTIIRTMPGHTVFGGVMGLWPDDNLETFDMAFSKTTLQDGAFRLHAVSFDIPDYGVS